MGLVLSGGGARGAYEVGVMSYVLGDLARKHGRSPHFDVIAATSVGAVNAAFLAASADELGRGASRLEGIWSDLQLGTVMGFGLQQARKLHRVVLGGDRPAGIFDARPLAELVGSKVPWRRIARNLRSGHLDALTVATTEVETGSPVVFVDSAPHVPLPVTMRHIAVRPVHVLAHHVLASAAIPMIFPPVEIKGELFCDGGLRLNTPMAPAIHMGMNRLFVVGVSTPIRGTKQGHSEIPGESGKIGPRPDGPRVKPGRAPGAAFLFGKVLNAFLLDHINSELLKIDSVNRYLEDGTAVAGPEFLEEVNVLRQARGELPWNPIETLTIRPSVDIGSIAGDHLRRNRPKFGRIFGRNILRLLDLGEGADADLASYLLFDGKFARKLIEQGRADARHRKDQIADFLYGDSDSLTT
ncbi:MAG: patatin-like phospholipase family protein [Myxococcota bacterium]